MFFTYLHHVSLGYILLLFISITSLARLNAQANLISYESNVCATELFQTKLICLNDRIPEEAWSYPPTNNVGVRPCYYADNFPSYSSACPSPPSDKNAHFRIVLSCLNMPNSVAISKVDGYCWSVSYLDTGNFIFDFSIEVQDGRSRDNSCGNITYHPECGVDRTWKQIGVKVSQSGCVDEFIEHPCNFISNGDFEDYTSCPDRSTAYPDIINFLVDWNYHENVSTPRYFNVCGQYIGRNQSDPIGDYQIPPQPFPSGSGFVFLSSLGPTITQFLNLCQNQKYKVEFSALRTKQNARDFVLTAGNSSSVPTNGAYDTLAIIDKSLINLYYNWNVFSSTFWTSNSYNYVGLDFIFGFLDNIQLYPMDTVIYNTQLIGSRCDSADAVLNIPGCYGPYDLVTEINGDTLEFDQLTDGFTIRIPITLNTIIKTLSITNSLGCVTVLNTQDTLIINNPGDAAFTSSDFCEGQTNDIVFLADTGLFSLVDNSTSSLINGSTGQIINPELGETYIISHAVCLDTVYDTITALEASADFVSSDICEGDSNTVTILGSAGGVFSLLPPSNGAFVNANKGVLTNTFLGNTYNLQYSVGGTCPDSTVQPIQVLSKENPFFELTDFCLGTNNQATITGSSGGTFSIENPFDSAYLDSITGEIINETGGGTYILKYVTPGICNDSSWDTVNVFSLPTASLISGGGDLCLNDSVPLNIQFTGASPWNVTYDNGGTSSVGFSGITSTNFTTYVSDTGTYSVFSVSDGNGCINVGDSTSVRVSGDSVSFISNILSGCAPLQVQLIPNIVGFTGGDCLWTMGDGNAFNNCDTVNYVYTNSGAYTPKFKVSTAKCNAEYMLTIPISVQNKPEAIFYYAPKNPSIFENVLTVTNTSSDNDTNSWFLNNNYVDSVLNPELVLPPVLGANNLCLSVINSFGCSDTTCSTINVLDESLIYVPNAFIPNNDGLNDVFVPVVSNVASYKLEIYNRWGRLLFTTDLVGKGWDGTYNGKACKEDVYLYKITYRFKGNFDDQFLDGHFSLYR